MASKAAGNAPGPSGALVCPFEHGSAPGGPAMTWPGKSDRRRLIYALIGALIGVILGSFAKPILGINGYRGGGGAEAWALCGVVGGLIGGRVGWRSNREARKRIGATLGGALIGATLGYFAAHVLPPLPGRQQALWNIGGVIGGLAGWLAWRRFGPAARCGGRIRGDPPRGTAMTRRLIDALIGALIGAILGYFMTTYGMIGGLIGGLVGWRSNREARKSIGATIGGALIGATFGAALIRATFGYFYFTMLVYQTGMIGGLIGGLVGWRSNREARKRIGATLGGALIAATLGYFLADVLPPLVWREETFGGEVITTLTLRSDTLRDIGGVIGGLAGWLAWRRICR